jgi:hypothetical protein
MMGWIEGVVEEVPLSAVSKEQTALAGPVRENVLLRARIPHEEASIGENTARLLVHMFNAKEIEDRDVRNMVTALDMHRGVLQYHLDRLGKAGLARLTGGNYLHGHTSWCITPKGRQYVAEHKLI